MGAEMEKGIDPHAALSSEDMEVLRARARRLASREQGRARSATADSEQYETYVCFRLLDERYGVPLAAVSEVFPLRTIVSIPGAPRHVLGLTRLRGKVIALVDLRRYWRGSTVGHVDSDLAVFVEDEGVEYGLVCNEVLGLLHIPSDEIEDVPSNVPGRLASSMRGFTSDEVMLLSSTRLRTQEGFLVLQGQGAI
jgi:purine-binding chemotaxis protein CheW